MQDLLTVLIQAVAIASIAIFTLDFYACLLDGWEHAALPPQPMPMSEPTQKPNAELTDPRLVAPAPIATTPVLTLQPVVDTRPSKAKPKKKWAIAQIEVAPAALARLSAVQLRQQCSKSGIQWRNAHGKGRHLTKQEMIDRLIA